MKYNEIVFLFFQLRIWNELLFKMFQTVKIIWFSNKINTKTGEKNIGKPRLSNHLMFEEKNEKFKVLRA